MSDALHAAINNAIRDHILGVQMRAHRHLILDPLEARMHERGFKLASVDVSRTWALRATAPRADAMLDGPVFLVQQDWHSFSRQTIGDAAQDFRLPFERCVFEMSVGGVRVAAWFVENDEDGDTYCAVFLGDDRDWVPYTIYYLVAGEWRRSASYEHGSLGLIDVVTNQVCAIGALREAGILEAIEVCPGSRLQNIRRKRGEPPLSAFLTLRVRTTPSSKGASE